MNPISLRKISLNLNRPVSFNEFKEFAWNYSDHAGRENGGKIKRNEFFCFGSYHLD